MAPVVTVARAARRRRLLAARARSWRVGVEAEHSGRLVALAAPRPPGRSPQVR